MYHLCPMTLCEAELKGGQVIWQRQFQGNATLGLWHGIAGIEIYRNRNRNSVWSKRSVCKVEAKEAMVANYVRTIKISHIFCTRIIE